MNELFLKIINMSISASWLILAVLILRLALKKASKWVNVLLWGIIAARLICPFSIESPVSLIPESVGNGELVSEWMDDYIGDVNIIHNNSVHYDAAVAAGREPISDGAGGYYVVTKYDQLGEPSTVEDIVIPVLAIIWTAGMVLLVLYTSVSYWRLRRRVDTAVLYRDNIFQSEYVNAPFVLGILKPRIYLPFKIEKQDLEHVVAHEQAHIRRKDHWWKPLGFLLLTIHWFNPLMWLAYMLLCRDIELACDEKVIKGLDSEQRAGYTQALVACSVKRRMIAACPLAFGEAGVKERVRSVMKYKKPAFWIMILAVITCAATAVCFLTNPAVNRHSLKWAQELPVGDIESVLSRYISSQHGRTYIQDAVSRGVSINIPDEPYLKVYLISEQFGEIVENIPLTDAQAKTILEEEREELTDGLGFTATLHIDGRMELFSEYEGVSQTVLDLAIERCGYKFADPGHITGSILEARLDCDWLEKPLYADGSDLERLREILVNAEFGYVGNCGYGAKLTIGLTGGEQLTMFKGTDGCDTIVFGSYGGYFLGDKENTEFWEIFGLDTETKEVLGNNPDN